MRNKRSAHYASLFVVIILVVNILYSQNGTEADNLASTERLFSSYTVDNGIRDGFLKYFDDSCVVFRPFAVNGHDWYANHKPIKGILSWYPTYVLVSSSGTLGLSAGPWEYRDSSTTDSPSGFGHFFSIWKKNSRGQWKVVLDMGNSYEKKERKNGKKEFIVSAGPKGLIGNNGITSVRAAEESFAMMVKDKGLKSGIEEVGSKSLHIYRGGKYPGSNKKESLSLIGKEIDRYTFQTDRVFIAESGDLAYTYGISMSPKKDTSNFVHVWRNEGVWKLIVDIMEPVKK